MGSSWGMGSGSQQLSSYRSHDSRLDSTNPHGLRFSDIAIACHHETLGRSEAWTEDRTVRYVCPPLDSIFTGIFHLGLNKRQIGRSARARPSPASRGRPSPAEMPARRLRPSVSRGAAAMRVGGWAHALPPPCIGRGGSRSPLLGF